MNGLWALIVSAFLAATILPLSSEVLLAIVVRRREDFLVPVAVATLGNYLGACTTYVLARAAAARLVRFSPEHPMRALGLFERYGSPALVLSWVPIVGDAIVALAGASRVRFIPFSIWTALCKATRYAFVAWAALNV